MKEATVASEWDGSSKCHRRGLQYLPEHKHYLHQRAPGPSLNMPKGEEPGLSFLHSSGGTPIIIGHNLGNWDLLTVKAPYPSCHSKALRTKALYGHAAATTWEIRESQKSEVRSQGSKVRGQRSVCCAFGAAHSGKPLAYRRK